MTLTKTFHIRISVATLVACLAFSQALLANTYDEAVDGDLANAPPATPFPLDSGFGVPISNTVTGNIGAPGDDIDAVGFTIDEGCTVDIILDSFVPSNGTTIYLVFDENAEALGGVAVNADAVGTSLSGGLVDLMGNPVELPPGEYSGDFVMAEFGTGPGADYVVDYQCTCPVPEPSALVLLGTCAMALCGLRRRLSP